jgi:hypothetical protein
MERANKQFYALEYLILLLEAEHTEKFFVLASWIFLS